MRISLKTATAIMLGIASGIALSIMFAIHNGDTDRTLRACQVICNTVYLFIVTSPNILSKAGWSKKKRLMWALIWLNTASALCIVRVLFLS